MIVGRRVRLRPVEERDLPLLAQWRNAPENRRFFFTRYLVNPGGQKQWYQALLNDRARVMLMIETLDGKVVGVGGLDHIDRRNQEAEAGQFMLDPAERGSGYAEEAAELFIRYAFEELNLNRLYGFIFDFNRVRVLAEFFGFKEEAVLRQAVYSGGRWHDKILVGLLREEWEAEQRGDQALAPTAEGEVANDRG